MGDVVRILESPNGSTNGRTRVASGSNGRSRKGSKKGLNDSEAGQHAVWIAEAVHHCVHERLIESLGAITLQNVCDEAREIAGEPLDHRYVFHI